MAETEISQTVSPEKRCKLWRCSKGKFYCWLAAATVCLSLAMFFVVGIDQKLLRLLKIHQIFIRTTHSIGGFGISDAINQSLYVVYNPQCQIPNYPPFHDAIKPFYKNLEPTKCSKQQLMMKAIPLLTSVTRPKHHTQRYILNLHKEHLHLYHNVKTLDGRHWNVSCCFRAYKKALEITSRKNNWSGCRKFNTATSIEPSAELVAVKCTVQKKLIYTNLHILLANTTNVQRKLISYSKEARDQPRSIMIIGLGSVSRLSFLRTMPLTNAYLMKHGWFPFEGYHKVYGNTFHNLVGPILTGRSASSLTKHCMPNSSAPLEKCPWIWKSFSDRNYITAYSEDVPREDSLATLGNFTNTPIDYFMRPFTSKDAIGDKERLSTCLGPIISASRVLEMSGDFSARFANHRTFSLFFLNAFSQDHLLGASIMDRKFVEYLENLKSSGVLNKTLVVFLSDHGFQKGQFRETYMGYLEDSLPFLFLWLPKWFRDKYPTRVQNVVGNRNKLTSHFDLHLTLFDILGLKKKAASCPKCVSLFEPVPWNRSCVEAGISEDACACAKYEPLPVDAPLISRMAQLAVEYINYKTASYTMYLQKGMKCSTFALSSVKTARRRVYHHNPADSFPINMVRKDAYAKILRSFQDKLFTYWWWLRVTLSYNQYVIHLVTQPGGAFFEATVEKNERIEVKSIIRLDAYSNKTDCMMSRLGKMYCNCEPDQLAENFQNTRML